ANEPIRWIAELDGNADRCPPSQSPRGHCNIGAAVGDASVVDHGDPRCNIRHEYLNRTVNYRTTSIGHGHSSGPQTGGAIARETVLGHADLSADVGGQVRQREAGW